MTAVSLFSKGINHPFFSACPYQRCIVAGAYPSFCTRDLQEVEEQKRSRQKKKSVGGRSRPAMSCQVIICDASSPWRLVIRDVGCYQSAGVEAYMSYRMPAAKMENTLNIKYINRILASMCFADGCIHYCSIYKRYQLRC